MKKSKIGFLTVHGDSENQTQMMGGVFEAAADFDVEVIRFASKVYAEDMNRYNFELHKLYEVIETQHLDGLMFLGWMPGLVGKYFDEFVKRFESVQLLSIGTNLSNIPNIYANHHNSIEELLNHLIHVHGYKKIVFVPPGNPDTRLDLYKEIMQKNGLYDEELSITYDDLKGIPFDHRADYIIEDIYDTHFDDRMKKVLSILVDERKVKFEAIIVMFDIDAQNLLVELNRRGLKVPEDVAVASYEDTDFSYFAMPPLTTISYPWTELGYLGCEKMVKIINHEQTDISTGILNRLIIRNSCGCSFNSTKIPQIADRQNSKPPAVRTEYKDILELSGKIKKAFPYTKMDVDRLLEALVKDLRDMTSDHFFSEFEEQLQKILQKYPFISYMDQVEELVYYIRNQLVVLFIHEGEILILFSDIVLKVILLLKEKSNYIIGHNICEIKNINQELHYVSQALISTFSTEKLVNVLDLNLSSLHIPSCYIFLTPDGSIKNCTLFYQHINGTRVPIEKCGVHIGYIAERILDRHNKLLCQLLCMEEECYGVVVFEPKLEDERNYKTLALHITSALKSAILLKKLTEEISLRKEKEDLLTYNADHDALTGLFNRRYFNKSMQYLMDYLVEKAKESLSFYLAYIDFDDFKKINDTYGHDVGDLLLVEVANRLNATLKGRSFLLPEEFDKPHDESKKEAIFRMGGDEFTTVLADISPEEMTRIAAELVNNVKAPYLIEGQNIHITCSIGISHYPEQADSAELLLKNADTAMYHAKQVKSMYCFYDDSM